MCLVVYVGSEQPQPTIPWDRQAPAVHTTIHKKARSDRRLHIAKRRLGSPYVYEIGSDTGCGCGFIGDDLQSEEEVQTFRTSRAALRSFVEGAAEGGGVRILACWAGDEGDEAEWLALTPGDVETLDLAKTWDKPYLIDVTRS